MTRCVLGSQIGQSEDSHLACMPTCIHSTRLTLTPLTRASSVPKKGGAGVGGGRAAGAGAGGGGGGGDAGRRPPFLSLVHTRTLEPSPSPREPPAQGTPISHPPKFPPVFQLRRCSISRRPITGAAPTLLAAAEDRAWPCSPSSPRPVKSSPSYPAKCPSTTDSTTPPIPTSPSPSSPRLSRFPWVG